MVTIGITGGIGSGKTSVCNVWKSLGACIINADDLAKKIMTTDRQVRQEIINTFGRQSYHPNGHLNRKHLAEEAFEKGRVKELNAIVHPRLPREIEGLMEKAGERGKEVLVYEAALLLQNMRPDNLDYVVLVLSDRDRRLDRVKERDQVSEKLVADRMQKQQDFDTLTHLADVVIRNNGSFDELKKRSKEVYYQLLST